MCSVALHDDINRLIIPPTHFEREDCHVPPATEGHCVSDLKHNFGTADKMVHEVMNR
jgi:hypothetical protein